MKRKLSSLVLALTLAFQAVCFQPRQAHAIIGAGMLPVVGPTTIAMGIFMYGTGAFGLAVTRSQPDTSRTTMGMIYALMIIGLVVLDDDSGIPGFGPLSDEIVAGAALTEDEAMAYGLEIPELNRAIADATSDLAAQGIRTTEEALAHPEAWQARSAGLTPETRSALLKIGRYLENSGTI